MNKHYTIKLYDETETSIAVRFNSNECLDLRIIDIKYYYENKSYDQTVIRYIVFSLDQKEKIVHFELPKGKSRSYISINFIVKDKTSKTQHAVRVPFNGDDPEFTEMMYEG